MQNNTTEWRGSRCSKPGINMWMSGKTDTRNNSERLMLTLDVLDAIFPVKYPKQSAQQNTSGVYSSILVFTYYCCQIVMILFFAS